MKTIHKFTGALSIVLFFVSSAQASPPKVSWQAGQLVLWNRTALEGDLSYNWAAEMVSLRQPDGRIRTFSANQVSRFSWFDVFQSKQRNFVSLVKSLDEDRMKQAFFEICTDGPLAVIRRMRQRHGLLKRTFSHPAYSNDQPTVTQNYDVFEYFVYDADRLLALDRYYADIYEPLMTTYDRELHVYALTHNINDRTLPGRLILIDHYNWLVRTNSKAASARELINTPN